MSIQSSPIAHQDDDQFELSKSSFLQLSASNENHTFMNQDELEFGERPKSFRQEYGREVPNPTNYVREQPCDFSESQ